MSVIPLKADIHQLGLHVRLVPTTEVARGHATGISVVTEPLKAVSVRKVDSLSRSAPAVAMGGERARQAAA